jgi:BRCT domain type II-containing protein
VLPGPPKPGLNGISHGQLIGLIFVVTGIFYDLATVVNHCQKNCKCLDHGKKELKAMIVNFGGKVVNDISCNVDYLVIGDEPGCVKVSQTESTPTEVISVKVSCHISLSLNSRII